MNVTNNDTLSALFNAAFGIETLRRAVFESDSKVSRVEANLALGAGLLAADQKLTFTEAAASKDSLIDQVAAILDAAKPETKKLKAGQKRRTATQQKLYMRINAQYLYYFGNSKTSKEGKKQNSSGHTDIKASATRAIKRYSKAELRAYIALLQAAL